MFPFAGVLLQRGIPFLFASGYGAAGLTSRFAACPIIRKPFGIERLKSALLSAMS